MASHVFVVDSSIRKARISTTPQTNLSDVLDQGCKKLGMKTDQWLLKYNGKNLDLTLSIRLSGLPTGAQLQLVQGSRSPSVVSVALQLADQRLTQKFPSNVSLWQVLRVFETAEKLNFTERAVPPTTNAGGGRLYYEMPVLNFMNREFGSLTDLQKTLAHIGLSGGSALLRLTFKATQTPLEEAMKDISQYFKSVPATPKTDENVKPGESRQEQPLQDVEMQDTTPLVAQNLSVQNVQAAPSLADSNIPSPSIITFASQTPNIEVPPSISSLASPLPAVSPAPETATSNPLTVYAPPSETTPIVTKIPFNDADYVPSMEHASSHQSRLLTESRNKRLPSDKELAARASEKAAAVAAVTNINVRIRCPDGSLVQLSLTREEATGRKLYDKLRNVARQPTGWVIKFTDPKGQFALVQDSPTVNLITHLHWKGSVLAYMLWEDGVDKATKMKPSLKDEAMSEAKSVSALAAAESLDAHADEKGSGFMNGINKAINKGKEKLSGAEKESKLKNLLGFGKKK